MCKGKLRLSKEQLILTMNVSTRCRMCWTECEEVKSMCTPWNDSIDLWNMYSYVMNDKEYVDSAFTNLICRKCEVDLKSAYVFKLMCSETEKVLGELAKIYGITSSKSDKADTESVQSEENCVTDNLESDIAEVYDTHANDEDYWNQQSVETNNQMAVAADSVTQLAKCEVRGRKCKVCDISFENVKSYQVHYRQAHSGSVSKILCSFCGKLVTKHSIDKHLKNSHSSNKIREHLCTICGNSFTLVENLKKHLRIHSNDKRYTCDICGEKFIHWNSKRSHIRAKHTGEKKYECNICGRKFAQSSNMFRHIRQHTNDLRHSCSSCSKRFQTKTELNNHLVVHTKEKNEMCVECFKCFGTRKSLRAHLKVHSGERNYICSVCTKSFTQPHVLRTHLQTHPGVEMPVRGSILSQKALSRCQNLYQ